MAHYDTFPTLRDAEGTALFACPACRVPLSASDLAELGLRAPDPAETVEEYCDAELLDPREFRHLRCREGELV